MINFLKRSLAVASVSTLLISPAFANETAAPVQKKVAVVNFAKCLEHSKLGQREQRNLEEARRSMSKVLEAARNELEETAQKLQDPHFLDSISAEEVESMKENFQKLNYEFVQNESQFMQNLNQAKTQFFQALANSVGTASKDIATNEGIELVIDNDMCFFYGPTLDITDSVLEKMNSSFDEQSNEDSGEAKS